ncbi:hypothetical protein O3P69_012620, partial [Scylla paramamosain]
VVCRFEITHRRRVVPPPAARGAIGVSRRGVRPAGPPPTSPPTVIVAVIGINQRAHPSHHYGDDGGTNKRRLGRVVPSSRSTGGDPGSPSHYYGDDGGTKRRGRVVPSLPQHGRRSGLVEEEWASRRDPPPTSPPTVIVAVIGINQRAHPSHHYGDDGGHQTPGDEWCLPSRSTGGDRAGSPSHYYGDDGGTKRRGRVVPSLPQHGRRSGLVEEEGLAAGPTTNFSSDRHRRRYRN